MRIGIDTSNIQAGGGVSHLKILLKFAKPVQYGTKKIIVWGGKNTIERLPQNVWLYIIEIPTLLSCRNPFQVQPR